MPADSSHPSNRGPPGREHHALRHPNGDPAGRKSPPIGREAARTFRVVPNPGAAPLRRGEVDILRTGGVLEPEIKLFCSYSHRDEHLRDELAKHLKLLERQGLVRSWHDRQIGTGVWKETIDRNLEEADIILLLISSDFLASDYCFDIEMKRALDRHAAGEALVIPVILRPVDWQATDFGKLQALPRDGKAVTTFENLDVAFEQVTQGVRRAIATLVDTRHGVFARSPAHSPDAPPTGQLSAESLGSIAKLLTVYIGPIATIIVRQAAALQWSTGTFRSRRGRNCQPGAPLPFSIRGPQDRSSMRR